MRTGGRRGVLPNGYAAVFGSDETCLQCCARPCDCCLDSQPGFVRLTLSGVQWCFGCLNTYEYSYWRGCHLIELPSIGINGTFILPQIPRHPALPNHCGWSQTFPCTGAIYKYQDYECTMPLTANQFSHLYIEVTADPDWTDHECQWHVKVEYVLQWDNPKLMAFYGEVPPIPYRNCAEPLQFQNLVTCNRDTFWYADAGHVFCCENGVAVLDLP